MRQRISRRFLHLSLVTALRTAWVMATTREQEREPIGHVHTQAEQELRYLAAHAPCLFWYGLVTERDDPLAWLDWHTRMLDEAAAQNFMPLDMLPGEVYPHAWWRHRLPDDRQRVDAIANEALRGGRSYYEAEFRCQRRDGAIRWFAEHVFVERRGQRAWHLVGVATDITDRKEMEAALRTSEERFRAIFEQVAVGLAHVGLDGRWLMANQRLCDIVGYRHGELLRTTFQAITHPDDLETDLTLIRRTLAGELSTYTREKRYIRKDGAITWVNLTVKLVHTSLGQPDYFVTVVEDINERKQLAMQLLQSQKIESIGRLAGGIAHDFNNLLTVMIGNIALARDCLPANAPAQSDLGEVEKAAMRAAELTRQLLAFARKQMLMPRVLVLNEILFDMETLLGRLLGEHIELITLPAPDLGRVKVDSSQIEQVLVNLVVNAHDAMPNGGQLTIETRNVVLDGAYADSHVSVIAGSYVMLAVSDTGIGMPPEIQAHLFEPFFTTKEPGQGTGLGLAICYGIIKQHGGNIWVYSEVGVGTTFKIYLPRVEDAAETLHQPAAEARLPTGTETVLLVEDEDAVRTLALRVLGRLEYIVLTATNGAEALRVAAAYAGTIHLALLDVVMPETGGKELAEHLAQIIPNLKVLFMSGYTDTAIVQHGWLDEGVAFLQKPFTPAALALKVRTVLDTEP
jgi:two-component system cell cycle sensor histidine kinase/response regulator CckA